MTDKKIGKKVFAALGVTALVVAAGLGAGFGFDDSKEVADLTAQNVELQTQIDDAALVEPEVVEVDNENLGLVLEHIYDNEGDVNYLTEDLDDDEVEEIVERIVFVNELKSHAVDAVRDNLFDELDKRGVGNIELDEDEMERLKIDDRDYEIKVEVSDWDDGEATAIVTGTFEQEDINGNDRKFEFTAELDFDDGEFDDFDEIVVKRI